MLAAEAILWSTDEQKAGCPHMGSDSYSYSMDGLGRSRWPQLSSPKCNMDADSELCPKFVSPLSTQSGAKYNEMFCMV